MILNNYAGNPIYPVKMAYSVFETYKAANSFTAAASPAVWNMQNDFPNQGTSPGQNPRLKGNRGYIKVDGAGDLLVEIANQGTQYNTQFTLKNGDSFDLTGLDISQIRFTWSGTNTNFRGFCA
jgi:hypothetical protein